jgi:hypothetical protein
LKIIRLKCHDAILAVGKVVYIISSADFLRNEQINDLMHQIFVAINNDQSSFNKYWNIQAESGVKHHEPTNQ